MYGGAIYSLPLLQLNIGQLSGYSPKLSYIQEKQSKRLFQVLKKNPKTHQQNISTHPKANFYLLQPNPHGSILSFGECCCHLQKTNVSTLDFFQLSLHLLSYPGLVLKKEFSVLAKLLYSAFKVNGIVHEDFNF